ncbi:IS66-like element accessory protein TnpA [Polaromonas sp.]|uniref:IS66-like element accessory protein TnpA n=1 Tax=Polaromonas sp. TaxID=1869339 RepID=UPI003BB61AB9
MDPLKDPLKATKRRHSAAFKRKLVKLTEEAGASVAAIALAHGINANLLFKWRRAQSSRSARLKPVTQAVLLPVTMDSLPPASAIIELPAPAVRASPARAAAGVIEIEVGGARVRLRGSVDAASVRCVLQALREAP